MRTIIVGVAALAIIGGPALAQPQVMNSGVGNYRPSSGLGNDRNVASVNESSVQQFRKLDVHKNGQLTRGEWTAAGQNPPDFAKIDTNKDRRIDLNEYSIAMTGRPAADPEAQSASR